MRRRRVKDPMVLDIRKDDGMLHDIVRLVWATVTTLHRKAAGDCNFTFFASEAGGSCDVAHRLTRLLRTDLRLGEGVTVYGLRRAIVDWAASHPGLSYDDKSGEKKTIHA